MIKDKGFEKARNLTDGLFQCLRCNYKFKTSWVQCEECLLAKGVYKHHTSSLPFAEVIHDTRMHSDCYCDECTQTHRKHASCLCSFCTDVIVSIRACNHKFVTTASEPCGCVRKGCRSLYVKWLNYLAPKYNG